jgi:hypothetical protein
METLNTEHRVQRGPDPSSPRAMPPWWGISSFPCGQCGCLLDSSLTRHNSQWFGPFLCVDSLFWKLAFNWCPGPRRTGRNCRHLVDLQWDHEPTSESRVWQRQSKSHRLFHNEIEKSSGLNNCETRCTSGEQHNPNTRIVWHTDSFIYYALVEYVLWTWSWLIRDQNEVRPYFANWNILTQWRTPRKVSLTTRDMYRTVLEVRLTRRKRLRSWGPRETLCRMNF